MSRKIKSLYVHHVARTMAGQLGIRSEDWLDIASRPEEETRDVLNSLGILSGGIFREDAINGAMKDTRMLRKIVGRLLYQAHAQQIADKLRGWGAESLGRVAICGQGTDEPHLHLREAEDATTTPYEVWPHAIKLSHSGWIILLNLAMIVIVAAMTDNILADRRKALAN